MFVKLQRELANIPKNFKILFWGGGEIHLLFTVNVCIKKSLKDEYPKYYWE
jgi:phosphoserine aminotransferase